MEEKLKMVLSKVFSMDKESITDNFSIDTAENWNSLNHSNLIIALEQAFNIEFTTDEIIEMMSYKLIRLTLQEKMQENSIIF